MGQDATLLFEMLRLSYVMGLGIYNEGTGEYEHQDFKHQLDIPQLRFQGLHHQFVASAKTVKMAHEIDPENKVGCMIELGFVLM